MKWPMILILGLQMEITFAKSPENVFELTYGPMVARDSEEKNSIKSSTMKMENGQCFLSLAKGESKSLLSNVTDEKGCKEIYQSLVQLWPGSSTKKSLRWPELTPHAPHIKLSKINDKGVRSTFYFRSALTKSCSSANKCQEKPLSNKLEIVANKWLEIIAAK